MSYLGDLTLKVFLNTYGFDGFDPVNQEITYPDLPKAVPVNPLHISKWLLLASFLGLPTRPVIDPDFQEDIKPKLTFKQLMKNFIGGWSPLYHYKNGHKEKVWNIDGKRILQLIVLVPIKILVILPLKILAIPFKIALNILKLFTEILPIFLFPLITRLVDLVVGWVLSIPTIFIAGVAMFASLVNFFPIKFLLVCVAVLLFVALIALIVGIAIVTFAFGLSLSILSMVSMAITSPEKSARLAYAAGGRSLGVVGGVLFAALSVGISAIGWTIAFPVVIGAIAGIFPMVLQAVAWVLHLPVLGTSLLAVNSVLTTAGLALGAAFGPAITFIATLLGVHVTASALILGTAVGMLFAPVCAIGSRVADELSNWWASGHKDGRVMELSTFTEDDHNPLLEDAPLNFMSSSTPTPGKEARSLTQGKYRALDESEASVRGMGSAANVATLPLPAGGARSVRRVVEPDSIGARASQAFDRTGK